MNKCSKRSETRGLLISSPAPHTARLRCLITCLETLLQNELNSDVARFTTHIKPVLQQIRLLTGLNVGGKSRTIAFELVDKLHLFVARFTEALTVRPKQFCIYCSFQASKRLNKSNSFQYNRGGGGGAFLGLGV